MAPKWKLCVGIAGVEDVFADATERKVVVKGKKAAADPMKLVEHIRKKTNHIVQLISPILPPPEEKKEEPEPPKPEKEVNKIIFIWMFCKFFMCLPLLLHIVVLLYYFDDDNHIMFSYRFVLSLEATGDRCCDEDAHSLQGMCSVDQEEDPQYQRFFLVGSIRFLLQFTHILVS